jgi:valyl-tRNA synthetase
MEIPKAYTPKEYEDDIYKKWEASGFFNPDNLKTENDAPSFVISMPPPNATGVLHVGHTLGITVQDIMTRYHRMKGDKTLMLPGTDHAAIATQNVVEKMLRKEGSSRHKLGREKFLERTKAYVEENKSTINNQTRKMGASCDWSREAYTLSDKLTKVVGMQFKKMYNDGLIYRGDRIVNWCPRCYSTLADDEVEHKQQKAKLYTFKYSNAFPFSIATTRPETKLGDTAVAVNPGDKRYRRYIGKTYEVDFVGVKLSLKIIGEDEVDPEFGTGAVGVTPAHSHVDALMGQKNDLEVKKVIGQDGKIVEGLSEYSGLKVKEAREKVVENLKTAGILEKEEDIENNLSICYRCSAEVEPLPSLQWFVAVDKKFKLVNPVLIKKFGKDEASLKEISSFAMKSGEIKIVPDHFSKTYFHWIDNLRDWCISRQIWFGHRIPAWYCLMCEDAKGGVKSVPVDGKNIVINKKNSEPIISMDRPKECPKCKCSEEGKLVQDPDTLDTWFSSALWTWSTLLERDGYEKFETLEDWARASKDLELYHPTQVMETMHDILFFWVARMIMMTMYSLNEVPFKNIYIHGMVMDKNGKKMSKSHPETIIEPIEVSEKYGTDALRLSMIVGNGAGNSIRLSDQKIASFRNFANKLWNIGRFIQMNETDFNINESIEPETLADKWIVGKLNNLIKEVADDIDKYRFGMAGEKLYDFTWHELADWYVEVAKVQEDFKILIYVYKNLLKMLHPFTPFVTEKIWEYVGSGELLIVEKWPGANDKMIDSQSEQDFELVKELVTAIRSWRKENKKEPKEVLKIQMATTDKMIGAQAEVINRLVKVRMEVVDKLVSHDLEVGSLRIKF